MKNLMRLGLALALLLAMAVGPTTPEAWSSQSGAASNSAYTDFNIRLALHQDEQMFMATFHGGEPFQLAMLDITIEVTVAGNLLTLQTYELARLDATGSATIYSPIAFEPTLTDFESTISACFVGSDGNVHHAQEDWAFGSKLVADFEDIAFISELAYQELLDPAFSVTSSISSSGSSSSTPPPSDASFAFTSQGTNPDGSFMSTGTGNYLVTSTQASFATVSGPAGIFTAN